MLRGFITGKKRLHGETFYLGEIVMIYTGESISVSYEESSIRFVPYDEYFMVVAVIFMVYYSCPICFLLPNYFETKYLTRE